MKTTLAGEPVTIIKKPRPCTCDNTVKDGSPYVAGRDCAKCYLWWNNASSRAAMEAAVVSVSGVAEPVCPTKWPLRIRFLSLARAEGELGVGDTLANQLGSLGRISKRLFKLLTGADCGCEDRQARMNRMYPYL